MKTFIATVDGQLYEVGDARVPFSIQSISKAMAYGIALEDAGREKVEQTVGVEPTGDAFNSINLEAGTGRPFNPMVNGYSGFKPASYYEHVQRLAPFPDQGST